MASKDVLQNLHRLVETQLNTLNITNYEINMSPGSAKGDNFLAEVTQIRIKGTNREGKHVKLHWIAKSASQMEDFREVLNIGLVFRREIYMYSKVFPAFEALQREKMITEPFASYPVFVTSSMEKMYETIIMKNLKRMGFQLKDRQIPLDHDHTLLVMREFGKFHGLSFALRDQKPELFEKLAEGATERLWGEFSNEKTIKSFVSCCERVVKTIDPLTDSAAYEAACVLKNHCFERFCEVLNPEAVGKYGVIGHGDSWVTNMLYKYEDTQNPKKPTRMCFLDFQLSGFGSPAHDLSYFLFTCTTKELRDKYYDEFLKEYHASLSNLVRQLGGDPELLFPFDAFLDQMKRFSVYGVVFTQMVLYLMMSDKDEVPNIEEDVDASPFDVDIRNIDKYKDRITGVFSDLARLGYQL